MIDRSKHDHGLHNLVERHVEAMARGLSENTPHAESDLRAVAEAELIPERRDGSLQGDVTRGLQYQKAEGGRGCYGDVYEWDGEELARRFGKP